jgi:deoxyribose-phosphate aldolase
MDSLLDVWRPDLRFQEHPELEKHTMKEISEIKKEINRYIDSTNVNANTTPQDIKRLCAEAREYNFASVAVNPHYVKKAVELLKGSGTLVDCAVGFPLGSTTTAIKAAEAREAIESGAREIDMVINIGELKGGNDAFVEADIRAVVDTAAQYGVLVKVVIETDLLTNDEKVRACKASLHAGAKFVKTSTGTRAGGATESDVRLMGKAVQHKIGVKAAGGMRSWEIAKTMLLAGATRLGTSYGVKIVTEAREES